MGKITNYLIPTSWNDYGMDWNNPDPFNPVYYNAITAALHEKSLFFGKLLQSYKKYYGGSSQHYTSYFQPVYIWGMTPFFLSDFAKNINRYASISDVYHCFFDGTYKRLASLQIPQLPTTKTGGICYSGNVLKKYLQDMRKWCDGLCSFQFDPRWNQLPYNIVYGYKRLDFNIHNKFSWSDDKQDYIFEYSNSDFFELFKSEFEKRIKNPEIVILEPRTDVWMWCEMPNPGVHIQVSHQFHGIIQITVWCSLPLYSVNPEFELKYSDLQIGFFYNKLGNKENVTFYDFGLGFDENKKTIINDPYFDENLKMYDVCHGFTAKDLPFIKEPPDGLPAAQCGFLMNGRFDPVYMNLACQGGFKFRPDA
jgi:hypothetical protein